MIKIYMIFIPPTSLIRAELKGAGITLKRLLRRFGPGRTIVVLAGIAAAQAIGEPWRELGPPADRKEALSRRQLGAAVLLERELRKHTSHRVARKITSEIVRKSSVFFLSLYVPILKKDKLLSMPDEKRKKYLRRIQEKFFNADADLKIVREEQLLMPVSRCRFVELLEAIGERDMAPMFCAGDRIFFDTHQPDITLERTATLSEGGALCDFRFRWK